MKIFGLSVIISPVLTMIKSRFPYLYFNYCFTKGSFPTAKLVCWWKNHCWKFFNNRLAFLLNMDTLDEKWICQWIPCSTWHGIYEDVNWKVHKQRQQKNLSQLLTSTGNTLVWGKEKENERRERRSIRLNYKYGWNKFLVTIKNKI